MKTYNFKFVDNTFISCTREDSTLEVTDVPDRVGREELIRDLNQHFQENEGSINFEIIFKKTLPRYNMIADRHSHLSLMKTTIFASDFYQTVTKIYDPDVLYKNKEKTIVFTTEDLPYQDLFQSIRITEERYNEIINFIKRKIS